MTDINIGDSAPDFKLHSTGSEEISLSDLKGKPVLLLFFPLAFTGVCTKELCHTRDNMKDFESLNVKVLGISVDALPSLSEFKKSLDLNFELLSDFNKSASREFGVLYEEFPAMGMKGVSKRAVFLINAYGAVEYKEVCASPGDMPDFDALKSALNNMS